MAAARARKSRAVEQPLEQLDVDHVVELADPEGLEQMVLEVGVVPVEARDPALEGRHDLVRVRGRPARS